jgi:hypothetical protein
MRTLSKGTLISGVFQLSIFHCLNSFRNKLLLFLLSAKMVGGSLISSVGQGLELVIITGGVTDAGTVGLVGGNQMVGNMAAGAGGRAAC